MDERVEASQREDLPPPTQVAQAVALPASAAEVIPRARPLHGERTIARVLRVGGLAGGACFAASIGLRLFPDTERIAVMIDLLQKAGASMLIATPVVRLGVAGVALGLRGEWRYLVYSAAIVALLATALGAGLAA